MKNIFSKIKDTKWFLHSKGRVDIFSKEDGEEKSPFETMVVVISSGFGLLKWVCFEIVW